MIDLKKLSEPFGLEELDWRLLQAGVSDGRPWGICAPYVDARAIMNRLDSVCGPECWQSKFHSIGKGFLCDLSIKVGEEWITKVDGSDETDTEPFKGGISKALVRAAVSWNVGRYLYDIPQQFADFGEVTKKTPGARYAKIEGQVFYWLSPHKLPAWALPEGEKKNAVEAPPSEPGAFVMSFGKFSGKRLDQIGAHDLDSYLNFLKGSEKKSPTGNAAIIAIDAYLKTKEVGRNK